MNLKLKLHASFPLLLKWVLIKDVLASNPGKTSISEFFDVGQSFGPFRAECFINKFSGPAQKMYPMKISIS